MDFKTSFLPAFCMLLLLQQLLCWMYLHQISFDLVAIEEKVTSSSPWSMIWFLLRLTLTTQPFFPLIQRLRVQTPRQPNLFHIQIVTTKLIIIVLLHISQFLSVQSYSGLLQSTIRLSRIGSLTYPRGTYSSTLPGYLFLNIFQIPLLSAVIYHQ